LIKLLISNIEARNKLPIVDLQKSKAEFKFSMYEYVWFCCLKLQTKLLQIYQNIYILFSCGRLLLKENPPVHTSLKMT